MAISANELGIEKPQEIQPPKETLDTGMPEAQEVSAPSIADKSLGDLRSQQLRLDAQIKRIQDSLQKRLNPTMFGMSYDPAMLKASAGFMKPTKTGSFGESLGYGIESYADETAKQSEKAAELEKLNYELGLKRYELGRKLAGQQFLAGNGLDLGATPPMSMPPTGGAPKISGAPQDATSGAMPTGGAQPEVSDVEKQKRVKMAASGRFPVQSPEVLEDMIRYAESVDMDKETIDVLKARYERQMKRQDMLSKTTAPTKITLPNGRVLEVPISTALKYNQGIDEGRDPAELLNELRLSEGAPTTSGAKPKLPPSDLEREAKKTETVETIKAKIEQQKKDKETVNDEARLGENLGISAKQMFDFANDKELEGMFGLLAKKGYTNAFFTAMKEPVKIGSVSIGVGNIEDVVRTAGGTDAQIAAARAFKKPASEAELAYTRIYLAKQGAITEGERAIVRDIMPGLADPAKIVRLKSELLIAKAQFDKQKADLFQQYISENPNATLFDFERSKDSPYKKLFKAYENHTSEIANEYNPGSVKKSTSEPSATQRKPSSLESAIQQEYAGQ
jgi:hypothetical protein